MNIHNNLEEFGLSKNESKIYYSLLKTDKASAADLYRLTGVHRRNVYDTLDRLMEKGLVSQISSGKTSFFQATNPEKLRQIVEEKNNRLFKIIPDLLKEFNSKKSKEEVFIYQGIEGFKNHLRDVLELGADLYAIGGKGAFYDTRIEPFANSFIKEAKKRKIKMYHLFDYEMRSQQSKLESMSGKYKFLPKEFSSNLTFVIYGERIVSYRTRGIADLGDGVKLFITNSPDVAEGHRQWFKLIWSFL